MNITLYTASFSHNQSTNMSEKPSLKLTREENLYCNRSGLSIIRLGFLGSEITSQKHTWERVNKTELPTPPRHFQGRESFKIYRKCGWENDWSEIECRRSIFWIGVLFDAVASLWWMRAANFEAKKSFSNAQNFIIITRFPNHMSRASIPNSFFALVLVLFRSP